MAKQQDQEQEQQDAVQPEKQSAFYERLELLYEVHRQKILIGFGIVIALIGGLTIYNAFIKAPKAKQAMAQISYAQLYFEQDSFRLALNGDGNYLGFKTISEKFSGTPAGNLSKYYAGICHLQLGEFKEAISYLERYKSPDPMVQAMALGCTGDAYMELGETAKGMENYEKAVKASGDDITGVLYLDRLAKAQEVNKQYKEAIASYERIKKEFFKSPEAANADKNIIRLQVMMEQ
jgi:tetratricopeptide (TPR) repeat protein